MKPRSMVALCASTWLVLVALSVFAQTDTVLIFAVITEVPTDKSRVVAQILAGGTVREGILLADERVRAHVMWRKLEMCHSVKAQALPEGKAYRVVSFKMVGASMLPMALQGMAGECLLKKAMEYAPLLD